jgi:hypothetical protein
MPNDETPRQRYRRGHRLTNEYVGATMLLFDREQPAIQQQQQQQIQPDDGKKE